MMIDLPVKAEWPVHELEGIQASHEWHDEEARLGGDDLAGQGVVRRGQVVLHAFVDGGFLGGGVEEFDYILWDVGADGPGRVV